MLKNKKHQKIAKWVGGILLALILIIGAGVIYLSAKWKPLVTTKIKEGVYEGSNKLYKIDFKDIHLNLLTGSVVLDSISLYPDSAVFTQLKAVKKAPTHLFRIKLAHLKIGGVGILTAYFKKRVNVSDIILDHPSIDMVYNKVPKNTDTVKDDRTLYQQISKSLKSIDVNNVKVIDADFDYYNGLTKLNSVKHLSINVKDILIDSLAQFDTTRVFHSKEIAFNMSGYSSLSKDKMYTLKIDTVKGSIVNKSISIRGLKMVPMFADLAFSRKYDTQKDRYDLSFNEINLEGVDFIGLNEEGKLNVKKIAVGPAKVAVFMNRELPPPNFDKGRNYPHSALKRLPIPTIVETLSLNKVDVAYTEFSEKTKERGTLKLVDLQGDIKNLTNDSIRLSKNNHAIANLSTYVMGKGKLDVKIDFNLTAKDAAFSYSGNIGPFNMMVLNPLSKPLGLIEIERGNVQSAYFNINANVSRSSGVVRFKYNNLKVNLLGENDEGAKEKKGLLSFLANKILIKDENPTKGEEVRTANVTFEREPQGSFFNLMWKSIFVGIRETVGIGIVPMKKMPEPKMTKKEERQKKRAERKAEKAKKN
ncbi:MAG: hypothetical protein EOO87_13780 [Pedobacter sp.]|nr:MAG: hypothetical protein EOO87_13780 [Pedobacter sp.]